MHSAFIHCDGFILSEVNRMKLDNGKEFTCQTLRAFRDGGVVAEVDLFDANLPAMSVGHDGKGICPVFNRDHGDVPVTINQSLNHDGSHYSYRFDRGERAVMWVFVPVANVKAAA